MTGGGSDMQTTEEGSPGIWLAREREARGMSLEDMSGRLKYSIRQIAALEADDYSRLPGGTFVRGMIRAYAKQVGTDPAQALALFDRRHVTAPVAVDLQARRIPFPDGKKKATRVYLVLSLLVLIAVGAVLVDWHFGADIGTFLDQGVSTGRGAPSANASPAPDAVPAGGLAASTGVSPDASSLAEEGKSVGTESKRNTPLSRIVMEFQRDSWVEVTDSQGAIVMSQLNPAGSSKSLEASPPLSLTIGNAQGVRLMFNDAPVDLKPHVKVDVARLTLE